MYSFLRSIGAKLVAPDVASSGKAETRSNMLADESAPMCEALHAAQGKQALNG